MANEGKHIGIAFIIIITALGAALVLPEFFNSLVNSQTAENRQLMQSIRIILVIMVLFLVGFATKFYVEDIDV